MTRQRYSQKEALNRILRLLEGKAVPTDVPGTISGEVLSTDAALSDIAELMANSLPGETMAVSTADATAILTALAATAAEAISHSGTNKFVTPKNLNDIALFGMVKSPSYSGTMDAIMEYPTLEAGNAILLTGSFGTTLANHGISGTLSNTALLVNQRGAYHAWFNINYQGAEGFSYLFSISNLALAVPNESHFFSKAGPSGTYTHMSGDMYFQVSGTVPQNWGLKVQLLAGGGDAWMITHATQFGMERIGSQFA